MAIYSVTVAPSDVFAAAGSPDVTIPFIPKRITLALYEQNYLHTVQFSFNGNGVNTVVHGTLTTSSTTYTSHQLATKIWLRRTAGAPSVVITAES
jgi:hypothetical protein